jgi:hypothetical protein
MRYQYRVQLRHYATNCNVSVLITDEVTGFLNFLNSYNNAMTMGSTQPLTEMSTRNLLGGKGRPALEADNLTETREPTVYKIWEPRLLTALLASKACYRDKNN